MKLRQILQEIGFEKIFRTRGLITINSNERAFNHIISDVRAIEGITTVREEEIPNQEDKTLYKSILNIKIDPYPFIKSDRFSHAQSQEIVDYIQNEIQKIDGVKSIRFSSKIEIKDN